MTTIPQLPFSGQQLRDTLVALDGAVEGKEASGAAAAAVAAHAAASDPHANYATTAELAEKVGSDDARLSDAREWSATTISQAEAEAGSATTRRAFTAQRVFQAAAAWWAESAAKTKLDGIAAGAEVNVQADWDAGSGDAEILNKPPLGTAAALDVGTGANNVVRLDGAGKLPAVDGSRLTNLPSGGSAPTFTGYLVGGVVVPFSGALAAGSTVNSDQISFLPFYVERAITIDELSARISTAVSGASFQLAFYNHANGKPTGNAFGVTGPMNGGVADTVAASITPVTLQPMTIYWSASNASAAIAYTALGSQALHSASIVGAPTADLALQANNHTFLAYTLNQTLGTWPDVTGASFGNISTILRRPPVVAMRISALP
jgi:hypothetical protein